MNAPPAIEVAAVSFSYDRWGHHVRALSDISLRVAEGEWVMLLGPNGSGKSTFLKLLGGYLLPQAGQIAVNGLDVATAGRYRLSDTVFLVGQDPTLSTAAMLTVAEHLMLAIGKKGRLSKVRIRDLLEEISLDVSPQQMVGTLSGGQRQLLVLLMARLRPCPVILLDEPMSALDPNRAKIGASAIEALHATGKTLLMATHDLDFAYACGGRWVTFGEGSLVADQMRSGGTEAQGWISPTS